MKELIIALVFAFLLTSCGTKVPREVTEGYKLPETLDVCIKAYQDKGDEVYNRDVEIRLLKEEIEELKKDKGKG